MNDKVHYVVGFAFNSKKPSTAILPLVRKSRPVWQAGKLNGVGGKVEAVDFPSSHSPGSEKGMELFIAVHNAMAREFKEETGVETKPDSWRRFARLWSGRRQLVHFFYRFGADCLDAKAMTDEKIVFVNAGDLHDTVIPNLRWMIPLVFDDRIQIVDAVMPIDPIEVEKGLPKASRVA